MKNRCLPSVIPKWRGALHDVTVTLGGYIMTIENDTGTRPAVTSMQAYRQHLRDITAIQTETIRRLVDSDTPPLDMAAVLEDIANKFLDMSDEIRDFALTLQEGEQAAASCSREEDAQA